MRLWTQNEDGISASLRRPCKCMLASALCWHIPMLLPQDWFNYFKISILVTIHMYPWELFHTTLSGYGTSLPCICQPSFCSKVFCPICLNSSCHVQPSLYLSTSLFDVHSLQKSYLTERGLKFFSPHPDESGDTLIGSWAAVTLSHELPLNSFELDSPLMHWNGFNAS